MCQAAVQGSSCQRGLCKHLLSWALFCRLHGVHDVHQHVAVLQVIVAEAQPPRVLGRQGVLQLLDLHVEKMAIPHRVITAGLKAAQLAALQDLSCKTGQ